MFGVMVIHMKGHNNENHILLFSLGHKLRFTLLLGNKTANDGLKMSMDSILDVHLCDAPVLTVR